MLDTANNVSADYANEFAETEFEKYRVIQDRLFKKLTGITPTDFLGK